MSVREQAGPAGRVLGTGTCIALIAVDAVLRSLSIRDIDGRAAFALRGELTLADTSGVASHLVAAVAAAANSANTGPAAVTDGVLIGGRVGR